MFSERAFFTFVRLVDPSVHPEYNAWHHLDHRPENLAQPGVAWGDRWQRTADCRALTQQADPLLADIDYVAMYWFREPLAQSISAWTKLGSDSVRWGRGPQLRGVQRPLRGFYTPVKGYAARRILVSPDVLPFRPNRGLHVRLSRIADPFAAAAQAQYAWADRVRIPDLLDVDGVAGVWTFSLYELGSRPWAPGVPAMPEDSLRLRLVYFDEDPVVTTERVYEAERRWDAGGRGAPVPDAEEVIASFPVRSISPW